MAAEARRLIARLWPRLFLVLLPFHAAIVALTWRLPEDPEGRETAISAFMIWLLFVIESLALAAGALTADAARRGADAPPGRTWIGTAALAPRLVATHALTTLVMVPGLVLLVVPGLFQATWFAFMPLAVALERLGGLPALRASRARRPRVRELLIVNLPVLIPVALLQNLPVSWALLTVAMLLGTTIAVYTTAWATLRFRP